MRHDFDTPTTPSTAHEAQSSSRLACERNRPAERSGRYPDQFGAGTSGFIGEWTRIQSNDKSPRIDNDAQSLASPA
jgi:hypothetical protein